jgi:hypothetical protein
VLSIEIGEAGAGSAAGKTGLAGGSMVWASSSLLVMEESGVRRLSMRGGSLSMWGGGGEVAFRFCCFYHKWPVVWSFGEFSD